MVKRSLPVCGWCIPSLWDMPNRVSALLGCRRLFDTNGMDDLPPCPDDDEDLLWDHPKAMGAG